MTDIQPAHDMDIVILAVARDEYAYPQFARRQVFTVSGLRALEGRRFRYAFMALNDRNVRVDDLERTMEVLQGSALKTPGSKVLDISEYDRIAQEDQVEIAKGPNREAREAFHDVMQKVVV